MSFSSHKDCLLLYKKRGTANATSLNEGPEKTVVYRCSNSSPRYSVRTTMLSLYTFESFSGFHSQEMSITLLYFPYVLDRILLSIYKGNELLSCLCERCEIFSIYLFIILLFVQIGFLRIIDYLCMFNIK